MPPRFPLLAVDALLFVGFLLLGLHVWGACAPFSEVAGDSFVAVECGLRSLLTGELVRPSQRIFGYGLCASTAPLWAGGATLSEFALRRAWAESLLLPASFLLLRVGLASLARPSPFALRAGATIGALAVLRHETLGVASSSGGHGYLVFPWIAVALLGLALAARPVPDPKPALWAPRRLARALPLALGMAAIPLAAMNHPYGAWLATAALALLPLLVARAGPVPVLVGGAVGLAVARPRVEEVLGMLRSGSAAVVAHQPTAAESVLGRLLRGVAEDAWIPQHAGALALLLLGVAAAVRAPGAGRADRLSWAAALLGAGATLALLYGRVGHIDDYHVAQLYPFAALGLGTATALGIDRLTGPEDRSPLRRRLGAAAGALLALGLVEAAGDRPLTDPWCPRGHPDSSRLAGSVRLQEAILADLDRVDPDRRVAITNLNLGRGRIDSAPVTTLGLWRRGVPLRRLRCCREGEREPVWYWIVDTFEPDLDHRAWAELPDVDLLLDRPEISESLFAVRSAEARRAIGEQLCGAIPPDRVGAAHYYEVWSDWLDRTIGPREGLEPPRRPVPDCVRLMQ